MLKTLIGITRAPALQEAGSAYREHVFFGPQGLGRQANPVIHMAWAPAAEQAPHTPPPSTGVQAHAGFECVTLLLQGQLQTRDSAGQAHVLSPGDVLWSSAGQGLLREHRHGPELARTGGPLELLTLWINLPAAYKLTPAHDQLLAHDAIPTLDLPDGAGTLRLIAGEWAGQQGPAETATPVQLWDIRLQAGATTQLALPSGWYGVVLVLEGAASINHWPQAATAGQLAVLHEARQDVQFTAGYPTRLILASGAPLNEAIASQDGLVMNTAEQLAERQQALANGAFGTLD